MRPQPASAPDEPRTGFVVCWLLCAAPFALPAQQFEGISRCALAALPWLAWSGAPRVALGSWRGALWEVAALLPLVALGAWVDVAGGRDLGAAAGSTIASAVLGGIGAHAARRAGPSPAYALAWIALVPAFVLLAGALVLGGASSFGPAPGIVAFWTRFSPLSWGIDQLAGASTAARSPVLALVGVALLALVAHGAARAPKRQAVA